MYKLVATIIYRLRWFIKGSTNKFFSYAFKPLFKSCGNNVKYSASRSHFEPYQNISIGNDVYIGPGANFLCTESNIFIGNKILFGPNVSIIGGDHNFGNVGQFIKDVHVKDPENDKDVWIEDDTWIGTNVTILKGVTVARGSVVAAGSVVTKSTLPYQIIGGVPAKAISKRFTKEEVLQHEQYLYNHQTRLTIDQLSHL